MEVRKSSAPDRHRLPQRLNARLCRIVGDSPSTPCKRTSCKEIRPRLLPTGQFAQFRTAPCFSHSLVLCTRKHAGGVLGSGIIDRHVPGWKGSLPFPPPQPVDLLLISPCCLYESPHTPRQGRNGIKGRNDSRVRVPKFHARNLPCPASPEHPRKRQKGSLETFSLLGLPRSLFTVKSGRLRPAPSLRSAEVGASVVAAASREVLPIVGTSPLPTPFFPRETRKTGDGRSIPSETGTTTDSLNLSV